ncbi:hypothetical protein N7509_000402 [Penicillium cosmopolitanum]|uniref:Uncharacterized protein n=1 Tax=Penicillium cosmopolitanum TaxID=1131564 RepID=A0A9W9WAE2_9EURO|nr:uncharacterized protein N7509_000402 [Penicillium cosmopolitanum]KAJ5413775.1 hypothetical protein N7509_000402 [Penicillium cosmopolitanum]
MEVTDRFFNEERLQIDDGARSYGWLMSQVDCLFCSDTFKSKQALHHILRHYEKADPDLRFGLDIFLQSDWARKSAIAHWKLFTDFDQVVDSQECLQSEHEYPDVASCCAYESPGAFHFLIRQGIIRSCYYNSFGHSLFLLAFQENVIETIGYMISTMSPFHLLAPASVAEMWDGRSILQLAATNSVVFGMCWEKIDQMPLDLKETLQEREIRSICQFASMGLASSLYRRGIDLADVVKKDSSLWLEMIRYHLEPTSLFDWLLMNNCLPPQDFLLCHPDPDSALDWLLANNFPLPCHGHGQEFLREFAIYCGRLDAAHWLSLDRVATCSTSGL